MELPPFFVLVRMHLLGNLIVPSRLSSFMTQEGGGLCALILRIRVVTQIRKISAQKTVS